MNFRLNTHSESYIAAIHDGVEKLGICGRLTDSPATGTGRFGTLGIWRFTFGRFTLGRLLVKLLQKKTDKKKKRIHNSGNNGRQQQQQAMCHEI